MWGRAAFFYSGLQMITQCHGHQAEASASLSLPIRMFISPRNTLTDTSRTMSDQRAGHSSGPSSGHIKLTITMVPFLPSYSFLTYKCWSVLSRILVGDLLQISRVLCTCLSSPELDSANASHGGLSPWTFSFVSSTQGAEWPRSGPPLPTPQTRNSLKTANWDNQWPRCIPISQGSLF